MISELLAGFCRRRPSVMGGDTASDAASATGSALEGEAASTDTATEGATTTEGDAAAAPDTATKGEPANESAPGVSWSQRPECVAFVVQSGFLTDLRDHLVWCAKVLP